jgi:hypothetical protein
MADQISPASKANVDVPVASPPVDSDRESPGLHSAGGLLRANGLRWGLAFVIASALSWSVLYLLHIPFSYPPELLGVDNFSPPAKQEALAAKNYEILQKTSLIKFALVGLFFGMVPLMVANWPLDRREQRFAAVGILAGVGSGLLAAFVALALRLSMNEGGSLARFGEGDQMLVGDSLMFVSLSLLLMAPISLALAVRGDSASRQQAGALLLAGLAGGGVVPIVSSFVLPAEQTNLFPPEGGSLIILWFLLVSGLALLFRKLGKPKESREMQATSSEALSP